ncbi:DsrS [hydrothermal vent metagenome]|uniref:DsrS n=1 Tax=hydrothermal vent metagenome TaxID=652676 RepID=A0A1W1DD14_9ZZZZ
MGGCLSQPMIQPLDQIESLQSQAQSVLEKLGLDDEKIKARLLLAGVSERLAVSTISAHSLAGSAIRKKLDNVLSPIQDALKLLTTP